MSLLIKALDKAQNTKSELTQAQHVKIQAQTESINTELATKAKAQPEIAADKSHKPQAKTKNLDMELSLSAISSPASSVVSEPVANSATNPAVKPVTNPATAQPLQPASYQISSQNAAAKSAANVFSAKGVEAKTDSTRLALIAGAGLIALLGMGVYFYQFVDNSPAIVVPPRPLEQLEAANQALPPAPEAEQQAIPPLDTAASELVPTKVAAPTKAKPTMFEPADSMLQEPILVTEKREKPSKRRVEAAVKVDKDVLDEDALTAEEEVIEQPAEDLMQAENVVTPKQKMRKSKNNAVIASDSASIQVTKSAPQAGVSPVLMSAYEAYNAGNDKDAIKLYKQVLQRDVRNIDALLGLGAIASRQGRSADANGWYGKVLELDPRNSIAKANLLDNQSQGNEQTTETSLKNMLAKQPGDANLHVALGNLYAEQNQWPAAQQAYFDAYSLNKTADNAYNLAVSLDQMGKPKLALPYYQRALAQATESSSIDKAALTARIAAIQ